MKKGKLLIALVAVLIVSCGALIAVKSSTTSAKAEEAQTVSTTEALISLEKEDLTELILTDSEGSLTFLSTEEGWDIKDAPDIPLDEKLILSTCNSLLDISSSRTINSPSLEEFGITEDSPEVCYTLSTGETSTLTLGSKTPDGNYTYAIKDGDTSNAYLVTTSKGSIVSSSLTKYRTKTLDTFDPASFAGLEVSGKALDTLTIEPTTDESLLSSFAITSPTSRPLAVNSPSLESLLASLPPFLVDEFIADDVTDFSLYGLDNPRLRLKLRSADTTDPTQTTTAEYLWGNDLDEDSIYFMKADTTSVYSMDSQIFYKFLEQLNVFNLSEKLVALVNISNVDSMDISFGETSYHLSIKREEIPAVETPAESTPEAPVDGATAPLPTEPEIVETYFINGTEFDEDTFKSLYQSIIGVSADIDLTHKETLLTGTPSVSFKFNFLDGSDKAYSFYPYDNQFYSHKVDDKLVVGCNIKQFDYAQKVLSELAGY